MRALEPYTGDLDALIERGTIRVLVPPSRTHFQVVNGRQRGRTVDAVARVRTIPQSTHRATTACR